MNKLILSLVLLIGFQSLAQEPQMRERRDSVPAFSAEQRASLKTKKLTMALDLSADQQEKVEELELAREESRQQLRESRKDAKKQRGRDMDAEERYNHMSQKMDSRITFQREMKSILTEAQYEKWKALGERHGKNRHRRHGKKSREHHSKRAH